MEKKPRDSEDLPRPTLKSPGASRFLIFQLLNIVALLSAIGALVYLHERFVQSDAVSRAGEVAEIELKRMRSLYSLRLSELREELLHLYGEQFNLSRALSDSERERLVFFNRDHLAAFGILVQGASGAWEVQKYFLRENAKKAGADVDGLLTSFKEAMGGGTVRRMNIDPSQLGVSWQSGGPRGDLTASPYLVAFLNTDDSGKQFGLIGVFKPSFVFNFCRLFTESLAAIPASVFVLNDNGIAVCHSQVSSEGVSFKDYSFFKLITTEASSGGQKNVRYTNLLNNNVSAAVRRIEPGGITFVAEANEVAQWKSFLALKEILGVVGLLGFVSMVILFFSTKFSSSPAGDKQALASSENVKPPESSENSDDFDFASFAKLRREIKDLEATVLEMQSGQAFLASFQKQASELSVNEDLFRFAVGYLSQWGLPLAWLEYDAATKRFTSGARANWSMNSGLTEPGTTFQVEIAGMGDPGDLGIHAELVAKLEAQFARTDLVVQPVHFQSLLVGVLVFAGVTTQYASQAELIPQIAQILAYIAQAKKTWGGPINES